MFLARTLGYLPKSLQLREEATIQASIEALRQGQVDGAMLTLDEVLQLRDHGLPLEVVLVFDVSKGADVLLAQPAITSPAQLRGRRIGAEDSALGSLMLALVLEHAGLSPTDVLVQHIPYEKHETAWKSGQIDALITYEPSAGRLKGLGARQLLSTRDLPDTIFDVLAIHTDAARSHADMLRVALAGYFKALTYLRQNPWDAAYRAVPHLGVSAEEMIASLRGLEFPDLVGNRRYLSGQGGELRRVAERLSPILQQAGLIAKPVDARDLHSGIYLPIDPS